MRNSIYIHYLIISLFVSLFSGCRSAKISEPGSVVRDSIVYIEKLVPITIPVDSAAIDALLECSEQGQVLLSRLDLIQSKNSELNFKLDSLGNMSAKFIVKHDTIYQKGITETIYRDKIQTKTEYKEKELTKWQKTKLDFGGFSMGAAAAAFIYFLVRLFFYIRKKIPIA